MGNLLKKAQQRMLEAVEEAKNLSEDEVWKEDMESADVARFCEQCLPPEKRSKLNLPINLMTRPMKP